MNHNEQQLMEGAAALARAFALQSRQGAKAELFANLADKAGDPATAAFFRAAASARKVQARRLLMLLRGKIPGDLSEALAEFSEEADQAIKALKEGLDDTAAIPGRGWGASFEQFLTGEKRLAELGRRAGEAERYHVCQICGYTVPGEAPPRCPVCGAVPEKFQAFPPQA